MKIVILCGFALLLSGCLTSESCTKVNGPGIIIELGCDEQVFQPITRQERLERFDGRIDK